ncbi:MAG: hypothetical protein ACREBM_08125 [Sphingomicrobium sp.]
MRSFILITAVLLAACMPAAEDNELDNADVASATGPTPEPGIAPAPEPGDGVSDDVPPAPVPPTPVPPPAPPPKGDCPITRSSDWHAHVNAMPGPNSRPKLIVSGTVTVPTGGYALSLRMGAVAESYPVQITVHLVARPPSGPASQALVTREVRGSWPSPQPVGAVTVRCGNKTLARISPVESAF